MDDLSILSSELSGYRDGVLSSRHALLVMNKIDLMSQAEIEEKKSVLENHGRNILGLNLGEEEGSGIHCISTLDGRGLGDLAMDIKRIVEIEREEALKMSKKEAKSQGFIELDLEKLVGGSK